MSLDYSELVAQIEAITENTFDATGSTNIDRIIQQAEQRCYNTVQFPVERKTDSTKSTVNGTPTVTLPTDFLAPFSVAIVTSGTGAYTYLLNKEPDFIREAYPVISATATPIHYALQDSTTMILGPTPNAVYNVVVNYFFYPESIVTADTTWLGDNFDSLLLAACLVEAAVFMKSEEDVVNMYMTQFKTAAALAKNLGNGRLLQDEYRSGASRTRPV
jgi:hypothetical protein